MATKQQASGYAGLFPELEIKQRIFILKTKATPLRYMIQTKHHSRKPLTHFNGKINRALRYATNQISPFLDEQDGYATLEPIVFENGKLIVPEFETNLQKFLMIHPQYGQLFDLFDPEVEAKDKYTSMNEELDAQLAIRELDIDALEAVARIALKGTGVNVSDMTSTELKRDMLIWAKKNPSLVHELVNDEDLKLRNLAVRAVEEGVLYLKSDQRTVTWASDKRSKVMVAPHGENVYTALGKFFKTDEGLDVMQKIVNLL